VRKRVTRHDEPVFAVTGLPASLQEEQRKRIHRYLLSMGIRTACFVLAFVTLWGLHWTVIGWLFVIAAAILPYIAVVVANATKPRRISALGPVTPHPVTPKDAQTPQISPRRHNEEPPR
jgi:hypothetical protein